MVDGDAEEFSVAIDKLKCRSFSLLSNAVAPNISQYSGTLLDRTAVMTSSGYRQPRLGELVLAEGRCQLDLIYLKNIEFTFPM